MLRRFRANRLNTRANGLKDKGWLAEADLSYRRAAELDPTWSVPWYNLGLMYKYEARWSESLECNGRATTLAPDDGDAWWNLGIAATATGQWDVAREAWRHCGIDVPAGPGPIQMDLGPIPIRLSPEDSGEVVWCRRIDPARAVIFSVPLPRSGRRWQDMLLHDGAAVGHRMLRGVKLPVFNELERLVPSPYQTFIVEIDSSAPVQAGLLEEIADERGGAAEDWSTSTHVLCRQCSEGLPHHLHDTHRSKPAHPHWGVAARDDAHLEAIFAAWQLRTPAVQVLAWHAV